MNAHVNAGRPTLRVDKSVPKQGLGERHLAHSVDRPSVGVTRRKEILDDQVIFLCPGVLKVGDGVHARGVGNLPGALRQLGHRLERAGIEDGALVGLDHEEDVVVLRIDVLDSLESQEVRVVIAEEDPIVRVQAQVADACANTQGDEDRGDENSPTPSNDEVDVTLDARVSRRGHDDS